MYIGELIDLYTSHTLDEKTTKWLDDYIDLNFYNDDLFEFDIENKYKDECDCDKRILNDDENLCICGNDTSYTSDNFMRDKIPMFPKNMIMQKYYDDIFPKRKYNGKIYYYLENSKQIYYNYGYNNISHNDIDTCLSRNLTFILNFNNEIILIEDLIRSDDIDIVNYFHKKSSKYLNIYKQKLEDILNKYNVCIEEHDNYNNYNDDTGECFYITKRK
jgi:hypothetical protein